MKQLSEMSARQGKNIDRAPKIAYRMRNPVTASFLRNAKLETLELGMEIVRTHHVDRGPVFFGPPPGINPSSRFDALGTEYRVCYAAEDIDGAFVETILHGKTKYPIFRRAFLEERAVSRLTVQRDLRLAMLHGEGLSWYSTASSISATTYYTEARRTSLALYHEVADLDGIAYRSRHDARFGNSRTGISVSRGQGIR